ncbi:MAG: hypothetical protein JXQ30_04665 [Spirochaetes bacterium]|nr:hypothetical protein [Spirochaetota bacterium]
MSIRITSLSKEKIIFSQSPVDMRHVLWLYERFRGKAKVSIYVTNVYNSYLYLKRLGLSDCSLTFIPYRPDFRTPIGAVRQRRDLKKLYKEKLKGIQHAEVYFFAYYYDWVTFYFLKRLASNNRLRLIDVYKVKRRRSTGITLSQQVKRFVILLITGVWHEYTEGMSDRVITFPYRRFGVEESEEEVDPDSLQQYMYRVGAGSGKRVLFFESNGADEEMFIGYEDTVRDMLRAILDSGNTVYIKPHPRQGHSKFIDDLPVEIIDGSVPAELLDIEGFDAVVGVESVSIANIAAQETIRVFSLLDLVRFKEEEVREGYRKYLVEKGNGRVRFVEKTDTLLDYINKAGSGGL